MAFRPYLRSLLSADRFQRDGFKAVADMRQERQAQTVLYPAPRLEGRGDTDRPTEERDHMSGTFDVCEERCDQCLFGPDKIVRGKRVAGILRDCAQNDSHFVCHKFSAAARDDQTCCRGFYDTGRSTNLMRIAERLGVLRFVPLPNVNAPRAGEQTTPRRGTT